MSVGVEHYEELGPALLLPASQQLGIVLLHQLNDLEIPLKVAERNISPFCGSIHDETGYMYAGLC